MPATDWPASEAVGAAQPLRRTELEDRLLREICASTDLGHCFRCAKLADATTEHKRCNRTDTVKYQRKTFFVGRLHLETVIKPDERKFRETSTAVRERPGLSQFRNVLRCDLSQRRKIGIVLIVGPPVRKPLRPSRHGFGGRPLAPHRRD